MVEIHRREATVVQGGQIRVSSRWLHPPSRLPLPVSAAKELRDLRGGGGSGTCTWVVMGHAPHEEELSVC
jgi:hypothetical protein